MMGTQNPNTSSKNQLIKSNIEINEGNDTENWLQTNFKESWVTEFKENGFLVINNLLDEKDELPSYIDIYEELLGSREAKKHRNDLGSHSTSETEQHDNEDKIENICQIMWPSLYKEILLQGPAFKRLLRVVKRLLGDDLVFDFDMLINKFPNTGTSTPWHQDESYWPDMPDKRAISCWIALDDATVDNGCMWFVRGSHLEPTLRPHQRVKEGHHARYTESCSESEGEPRPLTGGSCTLHHGRTLHYTRGNTTRTQRRAYILNFRPTSMVEWERERGFDHGKTIK